MGIRDRIVVTLAALAVVTGCFVTGPVLATEPGTVIDEAVLATVLARIDNAYVTPVDLTRLGLRGLEGLSRIDPNITVERTGTTVKLRAVGALAAEYPVPEAGDTMGWARLMVRAAQRLRLFSAAVYDAGAERVYQALMDSLTAELDGYTRYSGPERATGERAQRDGYGGIGLTLDFPGRGPVVREVLAGGPADRAGLRRGDTLTTIDGRRTTTLDPAEVSDRLRGPSGSPVTVTIERSRVKPRTMTLRRERVVPNTVTVRTAGRVGVLKLDRFNAATAVNLRDAMRKARRTLGPRAAGLVLDLRGNPGGLLDQAVAVADLFMPRGRILTTEGRHPDSRQRWDATPDDEAAGLPLVVLVDGRSASSAEVVAAALQDSGRAVVVGASSFGKGTVQTVTRLPNDGELFLTWSRIHTPAGYALHRQGVQPTICTSRDGADTPSALLADLRAGRTPSAVQLAMWRSKAADDDEALHHLRDACPWREHEPEVDLTVATALLSDPALYARAIALSASHTVAER